MPSSLAARRALTVCRLLGAKAPPRVAAQFWRMLFNGWCTARRFQDGDATCVFGCGGEDSIEHYCRCKLVVRFLIGRPPNGPGLHPSLVCTEAFFLIQRGMSPELVVRMAVALLAVFKARHAHVRGERPFTNPSRALRSFYHSVDS